MRALAVLLAREGWWTGHEQEFRQDSGAAPVVTARRRGAVRAGPAAAGRPGPGRSEDRLRFQGGRQQHQLQRVQRHHGRPLQPDALRAGEQFDRFVFRFHPHLRQRVEHLVGGRTDLQQDDYRQRRQVHLYPRHNRPDHRYASDPYTHENFWSLKRFYHFYLGVVAGIGHGGKLLESRNQAKRD